MDNQAFIDGQNLRLGTLHAHPAWRVDIYKLRRYLREKYHVTTAYYFLGAYCQEQQNLYHQLRKAGFRLYFREHSASLNSKKKGNVDTDIVFAMMRELVENRVSGRFILVSGDGEYCQVVKYLIDKRKFVKLLAPSRKNLSSLYRRKIADGYISCLDDPDIRQKLQLSY